MRPTRETRLLVHVRLLSARRFHASVYPRRARARPMIVGEREWSLPPYRWRGLCTHKQLSNRCLVVMGHERVALRKVHPGRAAGQPWAPGRT